VNKLQQWVALTVVGVLAVLAAGWFLVVAPKRSEASGLRTDADAQQRTNLGLEAQLATLKSQAKELPRKQAALAAVAAKIPDNPALPSLIRALSAAADDVGVELVSLAPSTPVVAVAPVATSTVPKTSGAAGASTPAAPAVGAATSVGSSGVGTLKQIPLAINVVGGYFQIEEFFDRLEHLSRALKVTGFSVAPGVSPTKQRSAATAPATAPSDPGKVLTSQVNALVFMSAGRISIPVAPVAPVAAK
jgi:Tfp pilus assembly protein PilO